MKNNHAETWYNSPSGYFRMHILSRTKATVQKYPYSFWAFIGHEWLNEKNSEKTH